MIYVLIVLWWPVGSQAGKAMLAHEFNTVQSCEAAKTAVLAMERPGSDGSRLLRATCVPK